MRDGLMAWVPPMAASELKRALALDEEVRGYAGVPRGTRVGEEINRDTFLPFRQVRGADGRPQQEWAVPGLLHDIWGAISAVGSSPVASAPMRPSEMSEPELDAILGHTAAGTGAALMGGFGRLGLGGGKGELGIFGGRVGAENLAKAGETRPLRVLDLLPTWEAEGLTQKQIWARGAKELEGTPYAGPSRGADGRPRFEIDDSGAAARGADNPKTVGAAINHPDYFKAYPDARNVKFRSDESGGGGYDPSGWLRNERVTASPHDTSTILHELQHRGQGQEGFAVGSSPSAEAFRARYGGEDALAKAVFAYDVMRNRGLPKVRGDAALTATNNYLRSAGEVEARAVESRMGLSADERRARPPWLDYEIPVFDQIVRFDGGVQKSEPPGIRYKDQGSRGTEGGTHNYVVFDDKLIEILRKYGLAGLMAGGAAASQPRYVPQD